MTILDVPTWDVAHFTGEIFVKLSFSKFIFKLGI